MARAGKVGGGNTSEYIFISLITVDYQPVMCAEFAPCS